MFSAIRAGGFIMLPIILCGIAATFIIIERCFYFYVTKKRDVKLMYDLNSYLDSENYDSAAISCAEADTPCSQVVKKALDCRRWDEKDMKDAVEAELLFLVLSIYLLRSAQFPILLRFSVFWELLLETSRRSAFLVQAEQWVILPFLPVRLQRRSLLLLPVLLFQFHPLFSIIILFPA